MKSIADELFAVQIEFPLLGGVLSIARQRDETAALKTIGTGEYESGMLRYRERLDIDDGLPVRRSSEIVTSPGAPPHPERTVTGLPVLVDVVTHERYRCETARISQDVGRRALKGCEARICSQLRQGLRVPLLQPLDGLGTVIVEPGRPMLRLAVRKGRQQHKRHNRHSSKAICADFHGHYSLSKGAECTIVARAH